MDLKTLSTRNRIEDHDIETEYISTLDMVADMGTKALPVEPFVRFRDTMNGYALVRAAFPDKDMSPFVYKVKEGGSVPALIQVTSMIAAFPSVSLCVGEK